MTRFILRSLKLSATLFAVFAVAPASWAALKPERLRCEHRVAPLGIQTSEPRLDWIVTSSERDQRQSAYQILVARDPAKLSPSNADLWDSGRLESNRTLDVRYGGKPIAPHEQVYWKVGVWDAQGNGPTWSEPSHWSLGPAPGADWPAQWIGCDELRRVVREPGDFTGAEWIAPGSEFPRKAWVLLATKWSLPDGILVRSADLLIAADNRCEVYLNGTQITVGSKHDHPIRRQVEEAIRGGENDLRFFVQCDGGTQTGLLARLVVEDANGNEHVLTTNDTWQAAGPADRAWSIGELPADKFQPAKSFGPDGSQPWGVLKPADPLLPPPIQLRSTVEIAKPVRRAVLYATALGICDVHLNGQRVSDDYFTPGWTDYARRVYFRTYDVTDRLRQGTNALGGVLADGWYAGYIGWGYQRDHYGNRPRFKSLLHVEYADGSTANFGTDETWKASLGGPQYADFLMGEKYDAREADDGWATADYDDAAWRAVDVGAELTPELQPHPGPPVRVLKEFPPKAISEPKPGLYVVDLGQNFAGIARLKVRGKRGQQIRMRFGERLNPDGTVYLANMRIARSNDVYVCKGDGLEVWEPRFTFHGFQYVEVTGLDSLPTEETITGLALSSDAPTVGSFACSSDTLNQLVNNIYWTQRANFIDIPTDCPQRDERLGWTGDAQVYIATAALHADVQAFFDKWLVDLADSQLENGQIPSVAPRKVAEGGGGPAWSDAAVVCPWTAYQVYGDRDILTRQYDSMKRFIEFCRGRSKNETLPPDSFHCYGDWLSINADTPKPVIYAAYYAQSTKLLAKAAEVLGKTADAKKYQLLHARIREAFNDAYVKADGRIEGDTQCCYVLALAFDLLDDENAANAAQYLVEDIESRGGVLSTGFVGTKDLMLALSKIGRQDVAYQLLETDQFPGWCFSIKHGATSIWERWDGWTPERGFQTPHMNSFAHYSFGAVYQWMVETIAGIQRGEPGYGTTTIAPTPGGSLTWANTTYHSIRGEIASNWKTEGDRFHLQVTIPANTTATVRVPRGDGQSVSESGNPVANATGVRSVDNRANAVVIELGSGSYEFLVE